MSSPDSLSRDAYRTIFWSKYFSSTGLRLSQSRSGCCGMGSGYAAKKRKGTSVFAFFSAISCLNSGDRFALFCPSAEFRAAPNPILSRVRAGELSVHQGYQAVRRRETEARRGASREENRRLVATAPTLEAALAAGARFSTIFADPPWRYGGDADWDPFGRGRPEYETRSVEQLCAMRVAERAADDAHLYLWTASRLVADAIRVAEAWGFRYASLLTWCKPGLGMGRFFRSTTEHVVFAVRGNLPLKRKDAGTWFRAPRGRHSEKPACFHELVESCSPGPYLELFARKARPGWTAWGAEAPAA